MPYLKSTEQFSSLPLGVIAPSRNPSAKLSFGSLRRQARDVGGIDDDRLPALQDGDRRGHRLGLRRIEAAASGGDPVVVLIPSGWPADRR
jgi:hypothetical protein